MNKGAVDLDAIDPDDRARFELAGYLRNHKREVVEGQGTIRPEFQSSPATRPPRLEFLRTDAESAAWLVRWPNGTVRWETSERLRAAGITLPAAPLLQG